MTNEFLSISEQLTEEVTPYFISWNSDGSLSRVSNPLKKLWGLSDDVQGLTSQLRLQRPFEGIMDTTWLPELTDLVLHLGHTASPNTQLRGQVFKHTTGWLFVGFPMFSRVKDLEDMGLRLSDLPLHYAAGELLIANEASQASLLEAQAKASELAAANAELQAVNETFARFVPQPFLEALGISSPGEAGLGDQVGTWKSVMFADLRQFTTISEMMQSQDIFKLINQYLSCVAPCIRSADGFVVHYLGDGIMALFRSPTDNAIKAAVEMQLALRSFAAEHLDDDRFELRLGIGIHYGHLALGIVGESGRWDSAVISDAVNTAARVEALTKTFGAEVLVTEAVHDGLADQAHHNLRRLGRISVKGKQKKVGLLEVLDSLPPEIFDQRMQGQADFELGLEAFEQDEVAEAKAAFQRIATASPDDLAARYYLSLLEPESRDGDSYNQQRRQNPS